MNLDQLLGSMSVAQLQGLMAVWAPEEPASRSKLAMFRVLRTQMTRADRAEHCLELADELGRGIVRRLVRSENTSQSVAVLAASSAARPRSIDETRAAMAGLAAMGLICVEPEKRWEAYGSARVGIPDELVAPLRQAAGIDERSLEQILNLSGHLATLPECELERRLKKLGVTSDASPISMDAILPQFAQPESCAKRIESLSPKLRRAVMEAVNDRAGIVPVRQLHELGFEPERKASERMLAEWRKQLEANAIGTVGDVSLHEYGIDLDGKALVVFTEVVEALLSAPPDWCGGARLPAIAADTVGPDFLLDLSELVSVVRESSPKLKASGELTGAASQRIAEKLNRPDLPLMDGQHLLELLLACAEKLGLVERADDSLAVCRSAWQWEAQPYEAKAADLFRLIGFVVPTPRSKHHHDGLCDAARRLLHSMPPGQWLPASSLAHIALRRYLAGLRSSGLREQISDAVLRVAEYVLPPFPGLKQLGADLEESIVMEAYAMGIIDLAVDGGPDASPQFACVSSSRDRETFNPKPETRNSKRQESGRATPKQGGRAAWMRLSDFGAVAAGISEAGYSRTPASARPATTPAELDELGRSPAKLITTADFEVIILPEGDTTRLRYEIGQFAAREKFEQTCHLRITKERVEEAVVRGLRADEMIRLLTAHSETGTVNQNVARSILGWAERVRVATVENVHVFELADERLLDIVAELPEFKKLIVRRISPTALALSEWPGDRPSTSSPRQARGLCPSRAGRREPASDEASRTVEPRKLLADLAELGIYVR